MRLFAFAALMALPLLTIAAPAAKADYYCCGGSQGGGYEQQEEGGYYPKYHRKKHYYKNYYHKKHHYDQGYGYHKIKQYDVRDWTKVYSCASYDCQTDIKLRPYLTITAICYPGYNEWGKKGWCKIISSEFKDAWVPRYALASGDGHYRSNEGGEGEGEGEGDGNED
jgi:hypothetical protein